MEIKKLLKIKTMGVTPVEANGVLLNDSGTEYPVLNDSLVNTIIFPQLQASGYKLIALPCVFEKDGVSTAGLPVEDFEPTEEQEQQLYTLIGTRVEGLESHVEKATVDTSSLPETKISIQTREQFLAYLDNLRTTPDVIPMPLGYFVSQNALFSYEEYMSEEYASYVEVIEKRHSMPYRTFLKLAYALKCPANATYWDIVKKYYAYGFDGIRYSVIGKEEDSSMFGVYNRYQGSRYANSVIATGFINKSLKKFLPEKGYENSWKLDEFDQKWLTSMIQPDKDGKVNFPDNTLRKVTYTRRQNVDRVSTQCSGFRCEYDQDYIMLNDNYITNTFIVTSDFGGATVPGECIGLNPEAVERYRVWQYLYALAKENVDKRIERCTMSSFKLLQWFNYSPESALRYVALKAGYTMATKLVDTVSGAEDAEDFVMLPDEIYDEYFSPEWDSIKEKYGPDLEKYETVINDIVTGVINCDNIEKGRQADSSYSASSIFADLYAVHYALGISIDEISEKIKSTPVNTNIEFKVGDDVFTLNNSSINGHLDGYKQDMFKYRVDSANTANVFMEVRRVFREVGYDDCIRHVGAHVLLMNRTKKINDILDTLRMAFSKQIETHISAAVKRNQMQVGINAFVIEGLFEIYHTGQFTMSKIPGAEPYVANEEQIKTIRDAVKFKIDSLQAFSKYTQYQTREYTYEANGGQRRIPAEYGFSIFCTNARMLQDRVIPSTGVQIPEVPFFAVWKNWNGVMAGGQSVMQRLIELGIRTPNDIPVSQMYGQVAFLAEEYAGNAYSNQTSLAYYADRAEEDIKVYKLDDTEYYKAVTHPTEYTYPNLYVKTPTSTVPDASKYPQFKIGFKRIITINDYAADLKARGEVVTEEEKGVRSFSGFSSEVYRLGLNTLTLIPEAFGTKQLINDGDKFYTVDTKEEFDYTRVAEFESKGYPIKHVVGNTYVVKLSTGNIVEVRI